MVICLERGADLHMAQLMPLPLTVSCSSEIQIGLPVWYRLTWLVLDRGPLDGCVCVLWHFGIPSVLRDINVSRNDVSSKESVLPHRCGTSHWQNPA